MGGFNDLYHAVNLIHEQEKEIEKIKETIKKRENEIAKLKKKSREKFLDTHSENYKVIKPDLDSHYHSCYKNLEKTLGEPILFTILVTTYSSSQARGFSGRYYMITNRFSYSSCQFACGDYCDDKNDPIIRGKKVLSNRTIDILIEFLSLLPMLNNKKQQYCLNNSNDHTKDKIKIHDVIDKCLAIIKMLE